MADGISGLGEHSGILGGSGPLVQESLPVFYYRLEVDDRGKIRAREECGPHGRVQWRFAYDAGGHLTEVRKNDLLAEYYSYDEGGRRDQDFRAWAGERRLFTWYYDGTLVRVNDMDLEWTDQDQLAAVTAQGRRTEYAYGRDTRLDSARLPAGRRVSYEYGRELMPVKVLVNGSTVAEYAWQDALLLARAKDVASGLTCEFHYGRGRVPERVTVSGHDSAMFRATGIQAAKISLDIWADQVGSIRVLSTPDRRPVKCLEYDSFGNITSDTRPEWSFPLGFACGLHDPLTGFVRFGFRDYDPRFGRFTAKDPALDLRGDGDLWDYCVDDPVGRFDPWGLMGMAPLAPSSYELSEADKRSHTGLGSLVAEQARNLALTAAGIPDPADTWESFTGQRTLNVIPNVAILADSLAGAISGQKSTQIRDGVYKAYEQFGPFLQRFRSQLIPIAKEKYKAAEERRARKNK